MEYVSAYHRYETEDPAVHQEYDSELLFEFAVTLLGVSSRMHIRQMPDSVKGAAVSHPETFLHAVVRRVLEDVFSESTIATNPELQECCKGYFRCQNVQKGLIEYAKSLLDATALEN